MRDAKRLLRLAQAQSEMARVVEGKLAAERQCTTSLEEVKSGTMEAIERAGASGLVCYASALRRLADIDKAIASSEQSKLDLIQRLLRARGHQELLMHQAKTLDAVHERKILDDEAREVSLAMRAKAAGKRAMLE